MEHWWLMIPRLCSVLSCVESWCQTSAPEVWTGDWWVCLFIPFCSVFERLCSVQTVLWDRSTVRPSVSPLGPDYNKACICLPSPSTSCCASILQRACPTSARMAPTAPSDSSILHITPPPTTTARARWRLGGWLRDFVMRDFKWAAFMALS